MRKRTFFEDGGPFSDFFDEPENPGRFLEEFDGCLAEEKCEGFVIRRRWPDGFLCPRCGSRDYGILPGHIILCRDCRAKTRVLAGTIFQGTKLPLTTWFRAAYLFRFHDTNAAQLAPQIKVHYKTALLLLKKFRAAL